MLIIGSHALNWWAEWLGEESLKRTPKDIDVICTFEEAQELHKKYKFKQFYPIDQGRKFYGRTQNGTHVEMEIAWDGSSADDWLEGYSQEGAHRRTMETEIGWGFIANPVDLYLLKMSHRFLKDSPHFHKTRNDIKVLKDIVKKYYGEQWVRCYKNMPTIAKWFEKREKETYNYSHPKLNTSKKDFFVEGGQLQYVWDHDSIHRAIAVVKHRPAYTLFSKDGAEVAVDKNKWEQMSHEDKLLTVYEEACVLALERSIIPFGTDARKAFDMALMKITSSISSGWWREWAWDHYDEVEALFDPIYVDKFWEGVHSGVVKPYQGGY